MLPLSIFLMFLNSLRGEIQAFGWHYNTNNNGCNFQMYNSSIRELCRGAINSNIVGSGISTLTKRRINGLFP